MTLGRVSTNHPRAPPLNRDIKRQLRSQRSAPEDEAAILSRVISAGARNRTGANVSPNPLDTLSTMPPIR
ncbi:MAG: hypothetical protein D6723_08905 [Acidobacteria bacterium]|nr:MAG: hypothetical protein D6723_08905 [Acidobacteriota bacterium]